MAVADALRAAGYIVPGIDVQPQGPKRNPLLHRRRAKRRR